MAGFRVIAGRSPAVVISIAALVFSLGGGAYAAGQRDAGQAGVGSAPGSLPAQRAVGQARTPAAALAWHLLRLDNGWHPLPGIQHLGAPAYAVSGGIVYLRGAMQGGVGADFAILPAGARPAHNLWISDVTSGPTNNALFIRSTGRVSAFGLNASAFSSLAGVSYPVSS